MCAKPVIAFLGIGLMGAPMARNLLLAGFPLRAWNRTRQKAEILKAEGAVICDTAAEAVAGADIIITMLSDGRAVSDLILTQNLIASMQAGALMIDMSSIKAVEARTHAGALRAAGIGHLDAPVSGGTRGAEAGSLAIMAGGDAGLFARAEPVFAAMGRAVHVGPDGAGQIAKLANQAIVGITIGAVAEAMLFVEKGGADPAAVRNALTGGFADSTILQQHGQRMTEGDFVPGGTAHTQHKDMTNVLEEAAALSLTLPLTQEVLSRYETLITKLAGGDKDHSALYLELLARNGLDAG